MVVVIVTVITRDYMQYTEYLKSDDWKQKRAEKSSKTNRCAICASIENIDTHHLNYKNLTDVEQSDLRKLCRRCHFLAHQLLKDGEIVFKNDNHHSRFGILKGAVKRALGIGNKNMFLTP
jgi:hypothetical protein